MVGKILKYGAVAAVGIGLAGGVAFGTDLFSYVRSSADAVREAVRGSVPVEFELKRARDKVEQIIPQIHANVRRIAEAEVEIKRLKRDIADSRDRLDREQQRARRLRKMLQTEQSTFQIEGQSYTRKEVRDDLARRLDNLKKAKVVLEGKQRLLKTRKKALSAAKKALRRMRSEKIRLQDQIETLASKHRLLKSSADGSNVPIDKSQVAETKELVQRIRKRLNVAERVLAKKSRFIQPIPVKAMSEADLLKKADRVLSDGPASESSSAKNADGASGDDT